MRNNVLRLICVTILLIFPLNIFAEEKNPITYNSHVESYGWMSKVNNGEISGTTGQSKRMEAFKIDKFVGSVEGDIQYRSYVEGSGWQDYVSSGNVSGTTGQSKKTRNGSNETNWRTSKPI